ATTTKRSWAGCTARAEFRKFVELSNAAKSTACPGTAAHGPGRITRRTCETFAWGRCLERLTGLLVRPFLGRQFAQLVVDQRQQLFGGVEVALPDGGQDARHLAHGLPSLGLACAIHAGKPSAWRF